jgi:hypothetical protein
MHLTYQRQEVLGELGAWFVMALLALLFARLLWRRCEAIMAKLRAIIRRRMTFVADEEFCETLRVLCKEYKTDIPGLLTLGVGALRSCVEALKRGARIVVVDESGKIVEEVVFPGFPRARPQMR